MRHSHHEHKVEEKLSPALIIRRRETVFTGAGIALTLLASTMVAAHIGGLAREDIASYKWGALALHALFAGIVAMLIYGSLVYQWARLAFIRRLRAHCLSSPAGTDATYQDKAPSVCFLVPSYKEERSVVEMTLLSAALQDYPNRRVVLLLDDPTQGASPAEQAQLEALRRLPAEIEALFAAPKQRMYLARCAYVQSSALGMVDLLEEYRQLSHLYQNAAAWVQERMDAHPDHGHADAIFIAKVLRRHRDGLLQRADALHALSLSAVTDPIAATARQAQEYSRLLGLFSVQLSSFERKRYENLSHEPNKAMNLNSYLGLMGLRYQEKPCAAGVLLEVATQGELVVPWADYVVTLDADSLLLTDYVSRLVHLMEQAGNARVAVIQTPYSAFPKAPGTLERIAGATTDIQYIIHQGFDGHGATYWVGANALIRRTALDDIVVSELERGYPVKRYIQDRTVIEDTESTIDLVAKGWQLRNYPERLAYSATPPDFGALLIQRLRWANGGLLILPKLIRHLSGRTRGNPTFAEGFMRLHYLVSIAAVNTGLLFLFVLPIGGDFDSVWLPLSALPYFFLYGRDLMHLGYSGTDLVRVYSLNLLLVPINLGGVFTSLKQAILKTKIPFRRTPKVLGRTAAPLLYILAEYALLTNWLIDAGLDIAKQRWLHAAFGLVNALLLIYAIGAFIGFKASFEDICSQWRLWSYRRTPATVALPEVASTRL